MALLAVVATLVVGGGPAAACDTAACRQRVADKAREAVDYRLRHRCNHSVTACIDRAAHLHRVNASMLRGRAWCESRLDPGASNGTHFGLFQFAPSTYASTPYARRGSIWSAKWNALAAAWMQRVGRGNEWVCA